MIGDVARLNSHVERDREHVNQSLANAAGPRRRIRLAGKIDLRQNLQCAALSCDDTNHATRTKRLTAML